MPGLRPVGQWLLLALFIMASIPVGVRTWHPELLFGEVRWPEVFWVALATLTSLAALGRQLPVQNVLATTFVILVIMGAVQPLVLIAGFSATDATQKQSSLGAMLWLGPWIWLIVLLNARGVARWGLRPWRSGANFGFAVLGVATVAAMLMQGVLESILTQHGYDKTAVKADTITGLGILIKTAGALLTLAVVTPFLINKRPVEDRLQAAPVIVWGVLTVVCLTWAISRQRWFGAVIIAGQGILLALLTPLGSRRCKVERSLTATP